MNEHRLKILREHYNNVKAGTKTFEIRKNDRAFQKGDEVELALFEWEKTWIACDKNPMLKFTIGDVYPIDAERVVFSLLPLKDANHE